MKTDTQQPIDQCPVMSKLRGSAPEAQIVPSGSEAVACGGSNLGISSPKRLILLIAGLFFVFLGAIGVLLPGIPTAGPLMLASICLTKSCPWLEKKLVRSRFFAPFHKYLDRTEPMPLRAKIIAISIMWISILASSAILLTSGSVSTWIVALIVLAGVIGTVVISRIGRWRQLATGVTRQT